MANPYKPPTKQRILNYLSWHSVVSGTELESQADKWYTKPSVISRRARELARDGKIDRIVTQRKTVAYKLKEQV